MVYIYIYQSGKPNFINHLLNHHMDGISHRSSKYAQMLHGAGVFTYKTGWFWWGKCWQLFQHHGTYGVTNIAGYNDTTSGFDGFKSSMQMDLTNSWIYIYNRIYNQQHMGYVELLGGLNAFSPSKVGDLTIKTLGIWPQKAIWWGYNVIDTQQNDTGVPK
jgi:hypothetical protein